MANYNTEISFLIDCTPAEAELFNIIVENAEAAAEDDEDLDWCGGFDVEVGGTGLWIWSEENVDVDDLTNCLQEWMQLDEVSVRYVAFAWACTCSKPRPEAFGGGAIFCTATSSTFTNTDQWMQAKIQEWKEATK